MTDPLSDILDLIGVRSSVYFQKDFLAPWCMSVSDTGFAQFHIIVRGTAVIIQGDESLQVSAGDIVFFPKGASHLIADQPGRTPMSGKDVIESMANNMEPFTEGGAATRMICGHFDYNFDYAHPLFEELPKRIVLGAAELPKMDHLFGLLQLIIRESSNNAPGSKVVLRRLSDSLLVTILRGYFEMEKANIGFHRGLNDKRISRAISAIHTDNNQYNVEELAELAGMSRSSFLHHFKALMGQSAGAYTTRWKLLKARAALSETKASVESIALAAGYNSATAFSRAFHSHFGETPSQYRSDVRVES